MRIYGCITCRSAWAASPLLEADGSHFSLFEQEPCKGVVLPFLEERLMMSAARDVHRAEATRDAAIMRAEAVASQAQKAIGELYQEQKVTTRAALRTYRAELRAERAEGILEATTSDPAVVMRTLLSCQQLMRVFADRRPCPSCRGGLDHRLQCRLDRLLSRIALVIEPRHSPHKIHRAGRRKMKRGA